MKRTSMRPASRDDALARAQRADQRRLQREERRAASPRPEDAFVRPVLAPKPSRTREGSRRASSPRPVVPPRMTCAVPGCERRAVHAHHALRESFLEREGADVNDPRVIVFLCFPCHGNTHASAFKRMPLTVLPDSVFEVAIEVGPRAWDELRRHYDGVDPRLDALLDA